MCGTSMLCIDDYGVYIDSTHLYEHANAMVSLYYSGSDVLGAVKLSWGSMLVWVSHRDAAPCVAPACCALMIVECILIVPISMHITMQWYHYTTVEVMSYMSSEVELRQSAPQVSHRDAGLWWASAMEPMVIWCENRVQMGCMHVYL